MPLACRIVVLAGALSIFTCCGLVEDRAVDAPRFRSQPAELRTRIRPRSADASTGRATDPPPERGTASGLPEAAAVTTPTEDRTIGPQTPPDVAGGETIEPNSQRAATELGSEVAPPAPPRNPASPCGQVPLLGSLFSIPCEVQSAPTNPEYCSLLARLALHGRLLQEAISDPSTSPGELRAKVSLAFQAFREFTTVASDPTLTEIVESNSQWPSSLEGNEDREALIARVTSFLGYVYPALGKHRPCAA